MGRVAEADRAIRLDVAAIDLAAGSLCSAGRHLLRVVVEPPEATTRVGFALALVAAALSFVAIFSWLPPYSPPGVLDITRPTLIPVPLLWAAVAAVSWRWRAADRMLPALALMATVLFFAHVSMLYSRAPHDTAAMVAHLGKVGGYLSCCWD